MAVTIRFETGQEDRVSATYGPFDFAQMTYNTLRVGPDGDDFAYFDSTRQEWIILQGYALVGDKSWWSDVVIG